MLAWFVLCGLGVDIEVPPVSGTSVSFLGPGLPAPAGGVGGGGALRGHHQQAQSAMIALHQIEARHCRPNCP